LTFRFQFWFCFFCYPPGAFAISGPLRSIGVPPHVLIVLPGSLFFRSQILVASLFFWRPCRDEGPVPSCQTPFKLFSPLLFLISDLIFPCEIGPRATPISFTLLFSHLHFNHVTPVHSRAGCRPGYSLGTRPLSSLLACPAPNRLWVFFSWLATSPDGGFCVFPFFCPRSYLFYLVCSNLDLSSSPPTPPYFHVQTVAVSQFSAPSFFFFVTTVCFEFTRLVVWFVLPLFQILLQVVRTPPFFFFPLFPRPPPPAAPSSGA